jgi:hypothetical protein
MGLSVLGCLFTAAAINSCGYMMMMMMMLLLRGMVLVSGG